MRKKPDASGRWHTEPSQHGWRACPVSVKRHGLAGKPQQSPLGRHSAPEPQVNGASQRSGVHCPPPAGPKEIATDDGLQHPRRETISPLAEQQLHSFEKPGSPQEPPMSPQIPSAAPSHCSPPLMTSSPHCPDGVGVGVGVGIASLNAGTHNSATDFATSTAGPKSVLFTDTVIAGNLTPLGSFA